MEISTQTTSKQPSLVAARRYLEGQLAALEPGQPLPAVRTMKKTLQISLESLNKVFQEFEDRRLIERQARRGIFKVSHEQGAVRVPFVDLVTCSMEGSLRQDPFFNELLDVFVTEASKRGQGARLHHFGVEDAVAGCRALACRPSVKACVLLTRYGSYGSPEISQFFREQHVAWVSLFPRQHWEGDRYVVLASPEMMDMALEHLWELGHRDIAYVQAIGASGSSESLSWIHHALREEYYRFMAERGQRVAPAWGRRKSDASETFQDSLARIFDGPTPPTALVLEDGRLIETYSFLQSRDIKIGRDVSIVTMPGLRITTELDPPVTSVLNPRDKAARMALEALGRILAGKVVDCVQYVPPKLIVRDSSGPFAVNDSVRCCKK